MQTFDLDERAWERNPQGPLTALVAELGPNLPPEVRDEWTRHNAIARSVVDAIQRKDLLTLRELRGVFGAFTARHRPSGIVATCRAIRDGNIT